MGIPEGNAILVKEQNGRWQFEITEQPYPMRYACRVIIRR
jgi:hypothetical protein